MASTHGNDLKILQFSVPEIYRVCFEFDIKRNKVLSLEYWRFRADDTVCHFCFKPKVGC
ncbi:MAG: hypothetical protein J6P21_02325 [Clostridia bacterium]|nr:hypothetical protein [Clostridia bacterium]